MNKVAKFEKVSLEQFARDIVDVFDTFYSVKEIEEIYNSIELPVRATKFSAGHDIKIPFAKSLAPSDTLKIPTGIRCKMDEGWVLKIYPRSGHGFKYGVHLANSCGIVDADYYGANNEGHIQVKLVNDSLLKKQIELSQGDAFCQGVFVPFGTTVNDKVNTQRTGGFGSTDNK